MDLEAERHGADPPGVGHDHARLDDGGRGPRDPHPPDAGAHPGDGAPAGGGPREGRLGDGMPLALPLDAIRDLQAMKTGALLAAAVEMGARLGGATDVEREALADYGRALGAAFQIADDILDLEGAAEEVGKAVGKDAAAGKATIVSALGREAAGALLADLVESAKGALAPFGARADILKETAVFVAARRK